MARETLKQEIIEEAMARPPMALWGYILDSASGKNPTPKCVWWLPYGVAPEGEQQVATMYTANQGQDKEA